MMAISMFLRTTEHLPEMTTISSVHFLRRSTKLSLISLRTDRGMARISSLMMASLRSVMVLGFLKYTRFEICTSWGYLPKSSRGWPKK